VVLEVIRNSDSEKKRRKGDVTDSTPYVFRITIALGKCPPRRRQDFAPRE
jgi:hypothetical protein